MNTLVNHLSYPTYFSFFSKNCPFLSGNAVRTCQIDLIRMMSDHISFNVIIKQGIL